MRPARRRPFCEFQHAGDEDDEQSPMTRGFSTHAEWDEPASAPSPAPAPAPAPALAPAPAPAPALEPVVSGIKGIIRNAHRNEDGTPKHKTRFLDISNGELDDDTPIEIYKVDEYKHNGGIINIDMDGLQIVKVRDTDGNDIFGAVGTQHIKLV